MQQKPCKSLGGAELRRIREESKLSQSRFAVANGYNPSTLSLWETGRSLPDLPNALRLERDFGIAIAAWTKDPPRSSEKRAAAAR